MKASNNNSDKGASPIFFADKNFSDADDASEGTDKSSSDNSVAENQAVLETRAIITHDKAKKNDTPVTNTSAKQFQVGDVFSLENEGSDDMTTLIDRKEPVLKRLAVSDVLKRFSRQQHSDTTKFDLPRGYKEIP